MKALLIVDMQVGCFKPYCSRHNTLKVVENINLLSEKFRSIGYLVIYIQHNGTKENYLYPDTKDFDLLPELIQRESDLFVVKEANEAFYNTDLDIILKRRNIEELYLCGLASNFCLDATIKSALSKDYKLYIASDAHTAGSNECFTADKLIEYHNWLWANLTPTKYAVDVRLTQSLIDDLTK